MKFISCFVFLGLASAWAQPTIPGTPAGRTFGAWFEAFNSGDQGRLESYYQKHEPGKSAEATMVFRNRAGGFDLLAIEESQLLRIVFRVKERNSETVAIGRLEVNEAELAKVTAFLLRAIPPGSSGADFRIDAATRSRVIDGAIEKLFEYYVFPEKAKKMEAAVRLRQSGGEYDAVTDGGKFARMLTEHFREVSSDKHLRVNFSPVPLPEPQGRDPDRAEQRRKRMEQINCGFEKVERLSGNIGLVKFTMFADAADCGSTVTAAMSFVSNADAIIFDLRENGGGDPKMVALISTYLFSEPTHLNDLWERKGDKTTQYWTLPYVPGKRLGDDKPAYVLTSSRTFSAAEEFSYNLQQLERATIVGETTGGGAHPVSGHRIDERFMIGVPYARAINPISKTNWEGPGVEPDVKVPPAEALETAHGLAKEKLSAK